MDIAREHKKIWLSFGGPSMLSIIGFIAGIFMGLVGPINPIVGIPSYSPSCLSDLITQSFKLGLFLFFVVYLWQILAGKPFFPLMYLSKILICNKCFKVKRSDGNQSCDCGGKFEDFDLWKWVEE